jgi:hypothetical protein
MNQAGFYCKDIILKYALYSIHGLFYASLDLYGGVILYVYDRDGRASDVYK